VAWRTAIENPLGVMMSRRSTSGSQATSPTTLQIVSTSCSTQIRSRGAPPLTLKINEFSKVVLQSNPIKSSSCGDSGMFNTVNRINRDCQGSPLYDIHSRVLYTFGFPWRRILSTVASSICSLVVSTEKGSCHWPSGCSALGCT
jgi:hypothetical protein